MIKRNVCLCLILCLMGMYMPVQAEGAAADASAADSAGEIRHEAVEAPPSGDLGLPVWIDDTIQQSAPLQKAQDGKDEIEPGESNGSGWIVMTLDEQALPLRGVRVGIDPGHQRRGNNEKEAMAPGSSQTKAKVTSGTAGVATRIAEYVTVLEISLKLRDALVEQGAEVYMTRETHDVNISNQERAKMMNDAQVDLVLRIHCDGGNSRSQNGIAMYCSRSNSIAEESHRAAQILLPAVCAATGAKANGIVSNDNYTGQNWSTVPCIMVECGFMSNPEEDRKLNDPDYQQKLAEGLTQGIIDYIAVRDGQ